MDVPYLILLLLCVAIEGLVLAEEAKGKYCDDGWHFSEDACFQETPPDMSWFEARDFCQSKKGNLAFFDSKSQFIQATAILSSGPTWIGLYSDGVKADSEYKWIFNKTKPSFSLWDKGAPTHGSTACVHIYKMPGHLDDGWHDESCSRQLPFICERPKDEHGKCSDNWVDVQASCYSYNSKSKSWPDARDFCKGQKAHLVVVNSKEEDKMIQNRLMKHENSWIGLWDPWMNDTWQWVDGTQSSWTNWRDGEPDNGGHLPSHCAVLGCDGVKGWKQEHCTAHHPYACEVILKNTTDACQKNGWLGMTWNTTGQEVKHCYANFMEASTWRQARTYCQKQNAELITLDTAEKATWAKETYFKNEAMCEGKSFWIGINDLNKRMHWTWLDSDTKPLYTDWQGNFSKPSHLGPTEHHDYDYYITVDGDYHNYETGDHKLPNTDIPLQSTSTDYEWPDDGWAEAKLAFGDLDSYLPPEHHEDVAVLMLSSDTGVSGRVGMWMNVHHTAYFPALCETEDKNCVANDLYKEYHRAGHCYRVLHPHEWGIQEETCRDHVSRGAVSYLAIINDQAEMDFIINMTRTLKVKPGVIIGLNAYEKPHQYTWLTSKQPYAEINRTVTYTNWMPGEPHRHPRHRCAVSSLRSDGQAGHAWSDAYCLAHLPGLCRKDSLSSEVYYDFKIKDNVFKVSHLRVGGLVDFDVLCTGLLGTRAYLAKINSKEEYQALTSLLHHQFSGAADLWLGNYTLEQPVKSAQCPQVLTLNSNRASVGYGACCESRYALCEKEMKSGSNYDVRVGNTLYKFFSVQKNVNHSEAETACQNFRSHPHLGHHNLLSYGTLATLTHAQQYMQLSSEMRIIYDPKETTKYWMGKSTSWIDFQDNRYVVRDAGLDEVGHCLVASLPAGKTRRLTLHDHIQIKEAKCSEHFGGYICQREMTAFERIQETNIFRSIFGDIMTRHIRGNGSWQIQHVAIAQQPQAKDKPKASACEGVCVGLAVALPLMCIVFFILGFLLARYFSRAGYMLMIPNYRRHGGAEAVDMISTSTA